MVKQLNAKLTLPINPFDGQEYVDAYRILWRYNSEDDTWSSVGYISDIPLARGTNDTEGPTNGLMSKEQKRILDATSDYAGGCGFIFKPGTYLKNGVDSILEGDIKLKSNTLDITCAVENGCDNVIRLAVNKDYLNKLCIEAQGAQGARGDMGPKGKAGRHGVGDGPKGATGADGTDATAASTLTGVIINDLSGIYDTAVVDLVLDSASATLEVTKARLAVPDSDQPASKVVASPFAMSIAYTGYDPSSSGITSLTTYTMVDGAKDLDVIKLPDGWTGSMTGPVAVDTMPVRTLIDAIARYYEQKAENIVEAWDTEITDYMKQKDQEGRQILMDKANELSEAVWQAPIEFCLTPSANVLPDCSSSSSTGTSSSTAPSGSGCKILNIAADKGGWLGCGDDEQCTSYVGDLSMVGAGYKLWWMDINGSHWQWIELAGASITSSGITLPPFIRIPTYVATCVTWGSGTPPAPLYPPNTFNFFGRYTPSFDSCQ